MNQLDDDGYPTDEALKAIEDWPLTDGEGLIEFISMMWWMPDWGFKRDGDKLELHTGGWSGNESIMNAFMKNMIYQFCWKEHHVGGHYYLNISLLKRKEGDDAHEITTR